MTDTATVVPKPQMPPPPMKERIERLTFSTLTDQAMADALEILLVRYPDMWVDAMGTTLREAVRSNNSLLLRGPTSVALFEARGPIPEEPFVVVRERLHACTKPRVSEAWAMYGHALAWAQKMSAHAVRFGPGPGMPVHVKDYVDGAADRLETVLIRVVDQGRIKA